MMAIMIAAASDAPMLMIVYSNMAEVVVFFVMCCEPAIEINWLIDLKFIANKMTTKQTKQTIYF